jgi:hypothetical protein
MAICDFCCTDAPVVASFSCDDFEVAQVTKGDTTHHLGSKGSWAACETCRRLVGARDVSGLCDRAGASLPAFMQTEARELHRAMFSRFLQLSAPVGN